MNDLVKEYRALPWKTDHLPDTGLNNRKCEILRALDANANSSEASTLLLDEAIQEVIRIFNDEGEDDMLRGWAERYVEHLEANLANKH